jgi:4-hydroxy-3-methylbut-2-enyl diphosphate reductase
MVEALRKRYPSVKEPAKDDICYATTNRQHAVRFMAPRCPTVLVVGAPASSNANRLVEVAASLGSRAYLIESAEDIRPEWLTGDVGLTAGASTPEHVVQACVTRVLGLGNFRVEEFKLVEERVVFPLPGELAAAAEDRGIELSLGNSLVASRARGEMHVRHH